MLTCIMVICSTFIILDYVIHALNSCIVLNFALKNDLLFFPQFVSINSVDKETEIKYRDDPMEIQYDGSFKYRMHKRL